MGTLMKAVIGTATGLFLVLAIVFFTQQKNDAKMEVKHQTFDRDWNESMATNFSKTPGEKAKFTARAVVAQSRISSAQKELDHHAKKVAKTGKQIDKTLRENDGGMDLDKDL